LGPWSCLLHFCGSQFFYGCRNRYCWCTPQFSAERTRSLWECLLL
jgi:hypothetical protein